MKLITLEQIDVPENVKYFDLFSCSLEEEGFVLEAKSPLFARFFKSLSKNSQTITAKWGGEHYLDVDLKRVRVNVPMDLKTLDGQLVKQGMVNLSWLRHTGLGEGFKILYPEAISYQDMEDFYTLAKEALRDIYLNNLQRVKLSASFFEVLEKKETQD